MTKEEVIKILKCLLGEKDSPLTDEQCEDEGFVESVYDEAIRVAIKALKRSETPNSSDVISRQDLCEYALNQKDKSVTPNDIMRFPSAQPEKLYTKADYIMALHKEYGCSLTRAKEAHNKALEYLQDEMMMKG